jgi:hypothetical protein
MFYLCFVVVCAGDLPHLTQLLEAPQQRQNHRPRREQEQKGKYYINTVTKNIN